MKNICNPLYGYYELSKSENYKKWESSLPSSYWDYRKLWHENPRRHNISYFPLHLGIEITTFCNLDCIFCYRKLYPKPETIHMDFELYKKIIDEGSRYGLFSINLNGLGEPLLHPNIVDMIKYAKDKGILEVMFHTNATLLTEEMSRKLIEAGLDMIIFSVDSPDKKTYEELRRGSNFDKTINNIKNFMRIREEMKSITPMTRITMVIMKQNQSQINNFIKLWSPIVDLITLQDCAYFSEFTTFDLNKKSVISESERNGMSYICSQIYQRLMIEVDGSVSPCSVKQGRDVVLGNARTDSLRDIWQGEELKRIRNIHESGKWDTLSMCKDCELSTTELFKSMYGEKKVIGNGNNS